VPSFAGWAIFRITTGSARPNRWGSKLIRPVDHDRDHLRGNPDAPLTLVEYGDYECPFCSRATGSIDEVRAHFGDDCATCGGTCRWSGCTRVRSSRTCGRGGGLQGMYFDDSCSRTRMISSGRTVPLRQRDRARPRTVRPGRACASDETAATSADDAPDAEVMD